MSRGAVEGDPTAHQPLVPVTLTVDATPDGFATAISTLSAGLSTTGPERSHPTYRVHPPLVEVGDETYVPPRVRETVPETDIVVHVPPSYAELFVAAPLAYYLGATVQVGTDTPRLCAPGVDESFGPLPTFQRKVARTLRRVFFLDCLVRDVPGEEPPSQQALLADIELSPESMRAATPAERLSAYLDAPWEAVESRFPTWHLSSYVPPSPEMATCLPFLLDDLSLIYLPEASDVDERGLLQRALDDFYRGPVASVDMVAPELQPGDFHAWLDDGVPVDAYTPSVAAFENRLASPPSNDPLDVAVVLNDCSMEDEHDAVAQLYRDADRSIDVTVYESQSVDGLARLFESDRDFVHFIGHCEVGGLQCPDGELDVASLSSVDVRAFFLNACGSYYQGHELIEQGSVAGAVTLRTVLNQPAVAVGTTFARLFVAGFGIEHAMQLARRQITMSTDYAVVGDGTYALADAEIALARLEENSDSYTLTYTVSAERGPGDSYRAPFESWSRLAGTSATTTLNRHDVPHILGDMSCPVIHDGRLVWSDDLAETFLSTSDE